MVGKQYCVESRRVSQKRVLYELGYQYVFELGSCGQVADGVQLGVRPSPNRANRFGWLRQSLMELQ